MRKSISKLVLLLLIFILVFSTFPLNVTSQTWENEYGKLEVYPDVSRGLIRQKQYYNATWYYPDNDLDIAFRFNESLSYGGVYFFNGTNYNKINHNHVEYNNKHYYVLNDIHFVQDEMKHGYWEYNTPVNSSGKWDMFIKLSSDTWQYAFANDRMVHLDPWWNSTYGHFKQISINSSFIENDLVNYPFLVCSSNTTMLEKMDDGASIRFTNIANTTEYPYEIEYFDDTSKMFIWVKIPRIYSSNHTVFNMYYNNSLVSDNSNSRDVWDVSYLAVYHMMDSAVTNAVIDSTRYSRDSLVTGTSGNPSYQQTGNDVVGYCVDYDGVGDWHEIPENFSIRTGDFTITMKMKGDTWDDGVKDYQFPFSLYGEMFLSWRYFNAPDNYLALHLKPSGVGIYLNVGDSLLTSCYYMMTLGYDHNVGSYAYCNKTLNDTDFVNTGDIDAKSGTSSCIAEYNGAGDYEFDGKVDELRISDIMRNTSWLNLTYDCLNMINGLFNISGEHEVPTYSTFNITNPTPVNNSEILCLNLSELCIDINFSCSSGDWVNITLIHDGNITYENDTTSIVNDTYCLSLSGVNLTAGDYYIWWVNVSSSCADETVVVNSWYNFTCEIGCDCYDELVVINYKLDRIQQTLDDGVGGGGIGGSSSVIGMIGLFGLFGFIGYLSGKKRSDGF